MYFKTWNHSCSRYIQLSTLYWGQSKEQRRTLCCISLLKFSKIETVQLAWRKPDFYEQWQENLEEIIWNTFFVGLDRNVLTIGDLTVNNLACMTPSSLLQVADCFEGFHCLIADLSLSLWSKNTQKTAQKKFYYKNGCTVNLISLTS